MSPWAAFIQLHTTSEGRDVTAASASRAKRKASGEKRRNIFVRIALFIRQIFAELKKVQRPTREELGQMFSTVLAFVAVIMILVGLLDLGFGRLTFWVFG
jgi:preprotein translocase, SecE subunit, bacterial